MGTSEKFSRSSRALSNISDFYGVTSKMSGMVVMDGQQRDTGKVIAVKKDGVTGGEEGGAKLEMRRKDCVLISHRTVLALPPRIERGW